MIRICDESLNFNVAWVVALWERVYKANDRCSQLSKIIADAEARLSNIKKNCPLRIQLIPLLWMQRPLLLPSQSNQKEILKSRTVSFMRRGRRCVLVLLGTSILFSFIVGYRTLSFPFLLDRRDCVRLASVVSEHVSV